MGASSRNLGAAVALLLLVLLVSAHDAKHVRSRILLLDDAAAHQAMAHRQLSVGNDRVAASHLHRALSIYRELGRRGLEASVLVELGRLHQHDGQTRLAIAYCDKAITTDAELRPRALLQRGQAYAELGEHERALVDFREARRSGLTRNEQADALYQTAISLSELGRVSEARAAVELSIERSETGDDRYAFYIGLLVRAGDVARAFEVSEEVRSGGRVRIRALQEELLDDDTRLLSYFLGDERSFLWSVTRGSLSVHELPSRQELEPLAREARRQLSSAVVERTLALEELSRLLLAPVRRLTGKPRLLIVSDGDLGLLPFGPLPIGFDRVPLVSALQIVRLPSVALLPVLRARMPLQRFSKWVAVAADPSSGLPAARREAKVIAALAPSGTVEVVLGEQASRQWVASADLGSFRVLHFATHGALGRGIALRDGFLRPGDLPRPSLPSELVVLSACDTGLARGFLEAGARRVIASYWDVDDEATAELMQRFYEAFFSGTSPAIALQGAQMKLRNMPRFRSPYYWAGFELRGDWAG